MTATDVRFQRLEVYGTGYITVESESAYFTSSTLRLITTDHDGGNPPDRGFLDIEFSSDTDLEDCYALVVSGSKAGIEAADLDELFVTFHSIGTVKKGETYEESFSTLTVNDPNETRKHYYFVVFYEAGMPLKSDYDTAVAEHFSNRNQIEFRHYLDQYLKNNSDTNCKHSSFLTFTPYLPPALYTRVGQVDAKVVFSILQDGRTRVESITGIEDEEAYEFISERVSEWLFFPALKDGLPVTTKTATRIQY